MTTKEEWRKVIDELPPPTCSPGGDYVTTRHVYADWLEEQGDEEGSRFQHWLADKAKCPLFEDKVYSWEQTDSGGNNVSWYFVLSEEVFNALPITLFSSQDAGRWRGTRRLTAYGVLADFLARRKSYRSRREAEEALLAAWKKTGEPGFSEAAAPDEPVVPGAADLAALKSRVAALREAIRLRSLSRAVLSPSS
jgi:hypothetical protein